MIQTKLGRRKSLALCTAATSLSTFAFIRVSADWAVVVSSMVISAAATAMYAVLCECIANVAPLSSGMVLISDGMTPETFGTSIRGTACGTSAALSRLSVSSGLISLVLLLTVQIGGRCTYISRDAAQHIAILASLCLCRGLHAHCLVQSGIAL